MAKRFSVAERHRLAAMPLDDLAELCCTLQLREIRPKATVLFSEFGRRLGVSSDAVAITLLRDEQKSDPPDSVRLYIWGGYSENRVAQMRQLPYRKWNPTTKCDVFTVPEAELPEAFNALRKQYARIISIDVGSHRVEMGDGPSDWAERPLYDLSDTSFKVNLADVMQQFGIMRPKDAAVAIALHGEIDPDYRTLFAGELPAQSRTLRELEFSTRHKMLLFRIPVANGRLRYLAFSAEEGRATEVLFADSHELTVSLAQMKEAQQRLAHPLIEYNAALMRKLVAVGVNHGVPTFLRGPYEML